MTREEAIETLKTVDRFWITDKEAEALEMAIQALSQEQDMTIAYLMGKYEDKEPCDDAISRQAALDCFTATKLKKFDFILYAREEIKKLPSVTQKSGHWIRISPAEIYECSECGQNVMTGDICAYKFCHGCGVRMERSDKE